MADFNLMRHLHRPAQTKIILLVLDGLGGLPDPKRGETELEAAHTPNMDHLAAEGVLGQTIPIERGITPGSGPAHLALFGYDPIVHDVGRGVLEASGVGMHVAPGDVAARGNFCTVDDNGLIVDRRAGRIPTDKALPIVERLKAIEVPGVQIELRHVREHRFALVMRGDNLNPEIEDTDPQRTGVAPLPAEPRELAAARTAELFNQWVKAADEILRDEPQANALTLRGFSTDPELPSFPEVYGLSAGCIAVYPMYRGVSKLVGMKVLQFEGESPEDEFAAAGRMWQDFDFLFIHIKKTDSKGEDGDFDGKVHVIEMVDAALLGLLGSKPDVLAITGDHSTPSQLRSHSWHPVPLLLWAPGKLRPDGSARFGERNCALGGLGTLPALDVMPILLASAGRLAKYGA